MRKNFSYLFLLQTANYIIPLILLPYLTHVLGAENFGKISFVQAFVAYFILITEYGFNTSVTREIVRFREDKMKLTRVFWTTTITKILFALAGLITLGVLFSISPKLRIMSGLILIAFTGVLSSILFPLWLFQGLEKMAYITWLNLIPRVLVLVGTLLFVKMESDFLLALAIQSGGILLSSIACSFLIVKQKIVGFYLPDGKDIKSAITEGWHIFISGVATNFYTTTNIVVLGFLTNDAVVGVFSASEKIVRSIISLLSSVSQVTFPRINSYYKESKAKALDFGKKLLALSGIIALGIGFLLFISAPLLVRILFGLPQYAETINIIRISSLLPFFAICNGILAINFLITFDLKKHLAGIVGIGCIFSLLFIIPAVLLGEAKGVAIIAVLTEILISFLLLKVLRRHNILNFSIIGRL